MSESRTTPTQDATNECAATLVAMSEPSIVADQETIYHCAAILKRLEVENGEKPDPAHLNLPGETDDDRRVRCAKFHLGTLGAYDRTHKVPNIKHYLRPGSVLNQHALRYAFEHYYRAELLKEFVLAFNYT